MHTYSYIFVHPRAHKYLYLHITRNLIYAYYYIDNLVLNMVRAEYDAIYYMKYDMKQHMKHYLKY